MDILFSREQAHSGWSHKVTFSLKAKLELDEEEDALVKRYGFNNSVLITTEQPGLVRNCFSLGLLLFVVLVPIIAFNFWREIGLGWVGVVCVSVGIAFVCAFFTYHHYRETIYVKDLLHGRHFKCASVIELARKEAYLENICGYLRQVIESAKHWDGDEKFKVTPLPREEAKRVILSGPMIS